MFNKLVVWLFYFKVGERNAPPIVFILSAANIGVLLVPEALWVEMGLDVKSIWNNLPSFLQYQLLDMDNKNAAFAFWVMLPFVFITHSIALCAVYNATDFNRYLVRRSYILSQQGKDPQSLMTVVVVGGSIVFVSLILQILFFRAELSILGDFVPTKNRLALALFYGFPHFYPFPMIFTLVVTEVRAYIYVNGVHRSG